MTKEQQILTLQSEIAETLKLIGEQEAQLNALPKDRSGYERMVQWLEGRIAEHRGTLARLEARLAEVQHQPDD